MEKINKNYDRKVFFWISWCIKDLWGTKVMYCYVVKLQVFSLQRGSAKPPIAPSNFSSLWFIIQFPNGILNFRSLCYFVRKTPIQYKKDDVQTILLFMKENCLFHFSTIGARLPGFCLWIKEIWSKFHALFTFFVVEMVQRIIFSWISSV